MSKQTSKYLFNTYKEPASLEKKESLVSAAFQVVVLPNYLLYTNL